MTDYESLVREHHSLVYRIALGILRRDADAADVTQDVFLDFLRRPEALAGVEDVRAFVARCAVNRALKSRRGEARRVRHEEGARREEAAMDPSEAMFRREVRAKVEELPEEERLAVDLHYFQGLSLAQAAVALEVTDRTVSNRLKSGLDRLRRALGAAGLAALLAGLESELGRADAEAVPAGMQERLLGLRVPSGEGASGGPRPRSVAAMAVAAALLAIVAAVLWRGREGDAVPGATGGSAARADGSAAPGGGAAASASSDSSKLARVANPLEGPLQNIDGIVVDPAGEPVPGALLETFPVAFRLGGRDLAYGEAGRTAGPTARSRADGTFVLPLERGRSADVRVSAARHGTVMLAACAAGGRLRVVLPEAVRLVVRLMEAKGAPVVGGRVRVVRRNPVEATTSEIFTQVGALPPRYDYDRTVEADGGGIAVFDDVPAGEIVDVDAAHPELDFVRQRVELPREGEATVDVKFEAGRTIRGRVVDAAKGEPIAGAEVRRYDYLSAPAVTDANGEFEFRGWVQSSGPDATARGYRRGRSEETAPGTYRIALERAVMARGRIVDAAGNAVSGASVRVPDSMRSVAGSATADAEGRFEVEMPDWWPADRALLAAAPGFGRVWVPVPCSGSDAELGDVVLPRGAVLQGRVLDAGGAPVDRAKVALVGGRDTADDEMWETFAKEFDAAVTDHLGRFRFDSLTPGEWLLAVRSAGRPSARLTLTMPETGKLEPVEVRLPGGSQVTVLVVDDAKSPLADCSVTVEGPSGSSSAVTGPDGRASLTAADPEVTASAWCPRPGHLDADPVKVAAGGEARLVFVRGGIVRGVIVDADGEPQFSARVSVEVEGKQVSGDGAGIDGEFEVAVPFEGARLVASGRYEGTGFGIGLDPLEWTVEIDRVWPGMPDPRIAAPELKLNHSVDVRVETADGQPAADIEVRAFRPGGKPFQGSTTDSEGRATICNLPEELLEIGAYAEIYDDDPAGETAKLVPAGQEILLRLPKR